MWGKWSAYEQTPKLTKVRASQGFEIIRSDWRMQAWLGHHMEQVPCREHQISAAASLQEGSGFVDGALS
jgi:hypothetical protein